MNVATPEVLVCFVGKLCGRVLIKRVRAGTECPIGEEQCGFRHGRGCLDQVFTVRRVSEKYLANGIDLFWHIWIWIRHKIQSIRMICGRC